MISIRLTVIAVFLAGVTALSAPLSAAEKTASKTMKKKNVAAFVQDELLVKFKLGKSEAGNATVKKMGAKLKEKLKHIDISHLKLPQGLSVQKAAEKLSKLDIVEFVEPNYIQSTVSGPNDPRFNEQWGLETIRALKGWGVSTGKASTVIAIVDTGVDLKHPDLKNKIVSGYNYVEDNNKPQDDEGHGTHCAGIAAASANNGEGIAGVCPNCSIMPVRGLGGDGQGTITTVANGIIYAADHGAKVISMSFGSPSYSTTLKNAIDYAVSKGVVLVAAAGNDGVTTPFYPAYLEPVIAVGSSTEFEDKRSYFSNYGDWVEVAAPGSNILSTVPGGYGYKQGTSMAAPFVSGLAGLMVSCSSKSATQVRAALLSSAVPVGNWVNSGRIDVPKALAAVGCTASDNSTTPSGGTNDDSATNPPSDDSGETPETPSAKNGLVTAYKIAKGKAIKEPDDALSKSDDVRLAVGSKASGMSSVFELILTAGLKSDVTYKSLKVAIEAYAENPGDFEVYFYAPSSKKWVKAGTVHVESQETTVKVDINKGKSYVSNKGVVKIRLTRTAKVWNGFELALDRVKVTGSKKAAGSTTPPESDQPEADQPEADGSNENGEKSATEKAKDLWNSWKQKL